MVNGSRSRHINEGWRNWAYVAREKSEGRDTTIVFKYLLFLPLKDKYELN